MDSVISTSKLHKCIKVINAVMYKGESITRAYYKSWSVLIRYGYHNDLGKTYISESNAMFKAKIMNEGGSINWQVANGVINDEL